MNIIIPIGGIGKRFEDEGYLTKKPLIRYLGREMIFYILDSFTITPNDKIYIVYHKSLRAYNFKQRIRDHYHKNEIGERITFVELFYQTEGAVETLAIALKNLINPNLPTVSFDCDTLYKTDILKEYRELVISKPETNAIYCFNDVQPQPIYSYIRFESEESNKIVEIREKDKISDWANSGCYCFYSGKKMLDYCEKILKHRELMTRNEFYISSVIGEMLVDGEIFYGLKISESDFTCIGTPHLLKINTIKASKESSKMRFCFDLDYTLVRAKIDPETGIIDYENTEPIERNIKFLQYLKSMGHKIIIQTARRMRTHEGSIGKLMADIGPITFSTLAKYNIPYDEIYFGKPWADYYIDDRAIDSYHDLEKELGYYSLTVPERSHNHIDFCKGNTVIKKCNNPSGLKGEIHWYRNIPPSVSDLFPKLISYSKDLNEYEINKIDGVTLSYLYLDENVTSKFFISFLETLHRIHSAEYEISESEKINPNSIYLNKLNERYDSIKYSQYKDSEVYYNKFKNYFRNINDVEPSVIHGDPVFTNVIITNLMNFKFIDMRGLQYDEKSCKTIPTILGDRVYDLAKVYQSLIGYDSILLEKKVNKDYSESLKVTFEKWIKSKNYSMDHIKWITAYLLFTLLPLHQDHPEKCDKYYELIKSLI